MKKNYKMKWKKRRERKRYWPLRSASHLDKFVNKRLTFMKLCI